MSRLGRWGLAASAFAALTLAGCGVGPFTTETPESYCRDLYAKHPGFHNQFWHDYGSCVAWNEEEQTP